MVPSVVALFSARARHTLTSQMSTHVELYKSRLQANKCRAGHISVTHGVTVLTGTMQPMQEQAVNRFEKHFRTLTGAQRTAVTGVFNRMPPGSVQVIFV